ncbi:GPW/gp25 family protein [Nannocystis punicea]|uniref:GPW/gp25 family protein n=1 Tax=Nannocystis punicea TaxID=2995304 RepID=A0ABY7H722_9BACT|nr:GPW/gp25 family protein [Nannocystis poenicansa]WAS94834.1 GPW/gp25 family protein [Nannocystis poenicansa]
MSTRDRGFSYPPRLGADRGVATLEYHDSVRAMIEQILFTAPGERANRPSFGVGAQNAVFDPNSPFLANRIRTALEENLYEHLARDVSILKLEVVADDAVLTISLLFQISDQPLSPQVLRVDIPLGGVE